MYVSMHAFACVYVESKYPCVYLWICIHVCMFVLYTSMFSFLKIRYESSHVKQSRWKPYLAVLPEVNTQAHPYMWPQQHLLQLLHGLPVLRAVLHDITTMKEDYDAIALPFITKHKDKFDIKGGFTRVMCACAPVLDVLIISAVIM